MAYLRAVSFLFLIPIILGSAQNRHRRGAQIPEMPTFPYIDYEGADGEEYESTVNPLEYNTSPSYGEVANEDTAEEIIKETKTVSDGFTARRSSRHRRQNSRTASLEDIFIETLSLKKLDFQHCKDLISEGEIFHTYITSERKFYISVSDPQNWFKDPYTGDEMSKLFTWEEAYDLCHKECKELISLDSIEKTFAPYSKFRNDPIPGVWTSGRRCDFPGCGSRKDVSENGWFWSTTGEKVQELPNYGPYSVKWAMEGKRGFQPDNAEFAIRGVNESCLALSSGDDRIGMKLHDLPCNDKLHVICEEPKGLSKP